LEETNTNASVISTQTTPTEATDIVNSFTKAKLEFWKDGVRNSVQEIEWTPLIKHCMYMVYSVNMTYSNLDVSMTPSNSGTLSASSSMDILGIDMNKLDDHMEVVIESPVQSGFYCLFWKDQTVTGLFHIWNMGKLD
jgi:hypothetical protein